MMALTDRWPRGRGVHTKDSPSLRFIVDAWTEDGVDYVQIGSPHNKRRTVCRAENVRLRPIWTEAGGMGRLTGREEHDIYRTTEERVAAVAERYIRQQQVAEVIEQIVSFIVESGGSVTEAQLAAAEDAGVLGTDNIRWALFRATKDGPIRRVITRGITTLELEPAEAEARAKAERQ